jgi:Protein of unknown function (DUF3108)
MTVKLAAALCVIGAASLATAAQRTSRPPAKPAPKAAAPRTAPRAERPVPFRVGETLTYDVSWSAYVTAGSAVATVKEKRPSFDSVAYYIVAEGRPTALVSKLYTLYYKLDTLLDTYTLLPQRGSTYSEEGSRHRLKATRFDRVSQKALFDYQSGTTAKAEFAVPPYTQDALSAIYVLRAVPLKAGDRMTMPISDDGRTFKMQIAVAAPERVKVPLGEFNAWRITPSIVDDKGQAVGRNLAL